MTRDEFLRKHASDSCEGDDVRIDLDALLAAARAEALEDAARLVSSQRHRYASDGVRNALVGAAFSIRALVKP